MILRRFSTSSRSVTLKVDRFLPYQQLAHIQRDAVQRATYGHKETAFLHPVLLLNLDRWYHPRQARQGFQKTQPYHIARNLMTTLIPVPAREATD